MDGHEVLGGRTAAWRALDEDLWRMAPMLPQGNDRFRAALHLERMGRHE